MSKWSVVRKTSPTGDAANGTIAGQRYGHREQPKPAVAVRPLGPRLPRSRITIVGSVVQAHRDGLRFARLAGNTRGFLAEGPGGRTSRWWEPDGATDAQLSVSRRGGPSVEHDVSTPGIELKFRRAFPAAPGFRRLLGTGVIDHRGRRGPSRRLLAAPWQLRGVGRLRSAWMTYVLLRAIFERDRLSETRRIRPSWPRIVQLFEVSISTGCEKSVRLTAITAGHERHFCPAGTQIRRLTSPRTTFSETVPRSLDLVGTDGHDALFRRRTGRSPLSRIL